MRRSFAILALAVCGSAHANHYYIEILTGLGSGSSFVRSINTSGQVLVRAGSLDTSNYVIYHQGTYTTLGPPPGASAFSATRINDLGHVMVTANGKGYLWSNGSYNEMPLPPGATTTEDWWIDVNGDGMAGLSDAGAFRYANGSFTMYPRFRPLGTNSNGDIIGSRIDNASRAVLVRNGVFAEMERPPNYDYSYATGLSSDGRISGFISSTNELQYQPQGVLWNGTSPTNITYIGSHINSSGMLVGSRVVEILPHDIATFYENGVGTDLRNHVYNLNNWWPASATALSNSGHIGGIAYQGDEPFVYLATPVPEPGSIAALGLGVVGLLARRRRSRRSR
jgi:uncharacterized membrane protein